MKSGGCPFESEVLEALQRGALSRDLETHIKTCPVCRDILRVHHWMGRFSEKSLQDRRTFGPMPDFETLWKKAGSHRWVEKELEKKALAPLLIPRILTAIVFFMGFVVLIASGLGKIKHFVISDLRMGFFVDVMILMGKKMIALLPFLGIPIIMMVSGGVVYLLYVIFRPKRV